jgi:predicted transposase/invertase (TIGR01784 family)
MQREFKYADLLDDDVFKLVFGRESSKDVMIEFLNQVIPDRKIIDLEFVDKEMHHVDRSRKDSIYDMFCKTDDGSRIVVEVQRRKQANFAERAIYYSTFSIANQVSAGAGCYDFYPVYVISILNFGFKPSGSKVKSEFRLYETDTRELLTDRVTFIFLDLSKFKKTAEELSGDILEGMYFCFKNIVSLTERPEILEHDVFRKIFEVSELINMDEVTRSKVIEKMTTERDLRNQMEYARQEAIAEGHAEGHAAGHAEGLAEGLAEAARKMVASGMTHEAVADILQIPEGRLKEML